MKKKKTKFKPNNDNNEKKMKGMEHASPTGVAPSMPLNCGAVKSDI